MAWWKYNKPTRTFEFSENNGTTFVAPELDAAIITHGTLANARLPTTPTFDTIVLNSAYPLALMRATTDPINSRDFYIENWAQQFRIAAYNDNRTVNTGGITIDRIGNFYTNGNISEKSRANPIGHWIDVPFNPANFEGIGGGVWTVATAPAINHYTLIGKTIIWSIGTIAGNISGTPQPYVVCIIPGGFLSTLNGDGYIKIYATDAGGVVDTTAAAWIADNKYVLIQKISGNISSYFTTHFTITFQIR